MTAKASSDSGIRCVTPAFMRSAGITQVVAVDLVQPDEANLGGSGRGQDEEPERQVADAASVSVA